MVGRNVPGTARHMAVALAQWKPLQDELSMRSAELAMLRDEHVRFCLSRARAVVPTDSRARMTRV